MQVAPVEQGPFDVVGRFVGRLRAQSSAELYARTDGPLTAVYAGSGDRVQAGQVLATIDAADAEQRVAQARAALRMAEATREQRKATLEVARTQASRSRLLFGQNLLSRNDLDLAEAQLDTAKSQLQVAEAQIEQARAQLESARLDLAQTRIIAPFDGFIGTRHLDLGAHATTNRPVFSIVDLSTIRTTVAVPAQEAVHLRRGQPATLVVDVLPDQTFRGVVARVSSVFDPQTNTVEAEVEIPNPEHVLKPGMYANVSIAQRTNPNALLVPAAAVQRNESEQWVFVAEPAAEGATARRVPVRALQSDKVGEGRVAVEPLDGTLSAGSNVIVLGQENLADGARVTIAAAATPAPETARTGAPAP